MESLNRIWKWYKNDIAYNTFMILLIGIVAYLVLGPLILLFISSVKVPGLPINPGFSLKNYKDVYTNPRYLALFFNTLKFLIGVTTFSVTIGMILAWLLERSDTPGRKILKHFILLPMATPPLVLAMSWVLLLSPKIGLINIILVKMFGLAEAPFNIYSLSGMIFVQSLSLVPVSFLSMSPIFRNMDPSLEDAAIVSGASIFQVIRRVSFPLLAPAVGASAAYNFIVGLVVFDIPGILGLPARVPVFSSQIYLSANPASGLPLYGRISSLSLVFLVMLAIASTAYYRFIKRSFKYVTITGKGYRPKALSLGKWRYVGLSFVLLYYTVAIIAPLGMLIWTSLMPFYSGVSSDMFSQLTLKNLVELAKNPTVVMASRNTLIIMLVAATVCTALSSQVSWVIVRKRGILGRILDTLTFIPLGIPNILLGLSLIFVYITFSTFAAQFWKQSLDITG